MVLTQHPLKNAEFFELKNQSPRVKTQYITTNQIISTNQLSELTAKSSILTNTHIKNKSNATELYTLALYHSQQSNLTLLEQGTEILTLHGNINQLIVDNNLPGVYCSDQSR